MNYFLSLVRNRWDKGAVASMFDTAGSRRLELGEGEILIREGDLADSVYILLSGCLEVSRSVGTESTVLATIDEPGSVVGEIVAMAGGERTATVKASNSAEVIEVSADRFRQLLSENSNLAEELVSVAMRRAEEVELTEVLADHFGIDDADTLATARSAVQWMSIQQGETLIKEGDESDAAYIVIRGRLIATTVDPVDGSTMKVGEAGRGDVVGDIGLLGKTKRNATVTAVRDSVVARLEEDAFVDLVERQPRMMIGLALRAVSRAREQGRQAAPNTILAVVGVDPAQVSDVVDGLQMELRRFGNQRRLSPSIVDSALGTTGISDIAKGEVGDIRVSKMIHEVELEADHLVIEVGPSPGSWSRRALGLADAVLMVVPPDLDAAGESRLTELLGGCPDAVARIGVVVRRHGGEAPTNSGSIARRLGAGHVTNIRLGSASDLSRLARVAVGRGNALVLSGGGGRGFAHIGVYKAMEELGLELDMIGGTSIGAVIGAVIADAMTSDEILDWAEKHFPRVLDYTIPLVSLTKGARIARSARASFGSREIEDLWRSYFAVSTDLTASRLRVHDRGSLALAIRATSAIPGVMPPVPDGDSLLIDGGVLNNLPIDVARARSPLGKIVAVDVAPPRGPGSHGDYGLSVSGWGAMRASLGSGRSRYPSITAVLMRSMITASMLERDAQISAGLADCYIDLDMRGVSMLEFDDPRGVATRGYEAAMPALERWLESQ